MRWILLLFLLPQLATAATITGTVYDLGLEEVQDAVVTISTEPEQRMVAKDGTYEFSVPAGNHTIAAAATVEGIQWHVEETVAVATEGTYTLDLILEPSFGEEEDLAFDEELPPLNGDQSAVTTIILLLIAAAALAAIGYFYVRMVTVEPPPESEDDEFTRQVLEALKRHKGRVTQKQLRKEMPFSEAKVSLVLTELEDAGRIRKIKKGRGNVIVEQ